MKHLRLIWVLFPAFVLITLAAVLVSAMLAGGSFREFHFDSAREDLEARARLLYGIIEEPLRRRDEARVQELVSRFGQQTHTRVTVVHPTGEVIADSQENPRRMENHRNRPEIRDALASGRRGHDLRESRTVGQTLLYVAIVVPDGDQPAAVVRTALPQREIRAALAEMERRIAWGALLVVAAASAVSWLVARRLTRPLEAMIGGARRFAEGDLGHRLPAEGPRELHLLARAMNEMAGQLRDRIATIERQRNEQAALAASMVEGVLTLDNQRRITGLNRAAAEMLEIEAAAVEGRLIHEVVRRPDLLRLVDQAFQSAAPVVQEVALHGRQDRVLSGSGTALCDAEGRQLGVVVVLHDVTPLRRLEQARREFLRNVTHELHTPLSGVKAAAETLLAGALAQPDDARRFVATIHREAERLAAMLRDVFTLERIERMADEGVLERVPVRVADLLAQAADRAAPAAAQRGIALRIECEPQLEAEWNPALIEQALRHLLDNAVRYSADGATVELRARRDAATIVLEVEDHGMGIAAEHLLRVFERFYRADPSRSRCEGGAGLGLAIVKHVAQAHGGAAEAESQPECGSIFRLRLPCGQGAAPPR